MARILTSGFELATNVTTETVKNPDGVPAALSASTSSIQAHGGTFSMRCNPAAAVANRSWSFPMVTGRTYFARTFIYVATGPAAAISLMACPTAPLQVRMDSSRQVSLWTGATIGSTSPAVPLNTWTMIEMSFLYGAGSIDTAGLRINTAVISALTGLSISDAAETSFHVGSELSGTYDIYFDDFAINDDQGANQNSWCGDAKIVLLRPTADSAVGTSWTDSGASATGLFASVDNQPPTGIADTTASAGHQIRNAGSASASYDATMTTYTAAGLTAGDSPTVIVPFCNTGAPVVTAAKTGSLGVASNPTITNIAFVNGATAAANFWSGVTAGTWPVGWKWEYGTTTYNPAVTKGTAPVARVTITGGTAARIAMVDEIGMYVEYTSPNTFAAEQENMRGTQFSLETLQRTSVGRGAFFCVGWLRRRLRLSSRPSGSLGRCSLPAPPPPTAT